MPVVQRINDESARTSRRRARPQPNPARPSAPGKRPAASRAQRQRLRKRRRTKRVIWRVALCLLTAVVLILIAALAAGLAAFRGPSQTMGDLLTVSMLETSALKFVPYIYYSADRVDAIVARNQVAEVTEETDTSMIVIAPPTPEPTAVPAATDAPQELAQAEPEPVITQAPTASPVPTTPPIIQEDGIEIYAVKGSTYNGYMMIVRDPSRVTVGTCRDSFSGGAGLKLEGIAERYNAIAAINGGGFADLNGSGNGGTPIGLVISEGKLLHKHDFDSIHNITVGFNADNILMIGKYTTNEAQEKGLRDALAFGPVLVMNDEAAEVSGLSSGLNPRTAIGQRADGAVLMLVIDGRQASSFGATYSDLIAIMLEYGAVNACNLDGGSSSLLYYRGDFVNNGVVLTGSRSLPDAFIVR